MEIKHQEWIERIILRIKVRVLELRREEHKRQVANCGATKSNDG